MEIVFRKTNELIPYARNARTHDDAQVAQIAGSIKEFGFTNPILIDQDGGIIAGHGRVRAAQLLGMAEVPTITLAHLTDTQKRAYIIADNKMALNAGWNDELLKVELEALKADDFDLLLTGFDPDELGKMFSVEPNGKDAEPKVDDAAELAQKWGVEVGQVWQLGDHRIICGDATDRAVVDAVMQGEKANLVFTDPPYGVAIAAKSEMLNKVQKSKRKKPICDDACSPNDLKKRLVPAFQNIKDAVMADDCTVFITFPVSGELGPMFFNVMHEVGFPLRHMLIWKKNAPTFSMGRLDYDYQHEPILLTWGKKHKRPMLGKHKTSVWEIDKPRASAQHPTMKPVELVVNAIMNNSDPGDITFDAYSGSGTSIMAAEQTGRKCRAIEIEPGYVAVALERWAEATGKSPVKL